MNKKLSIKNCLIALLGIFFIGVGVAFNAMAHLGNDPVGIFYDGIRNTLGLTQVQLGAASYLVNILLAVLLIFIGKKYLNLGTLIYILPYGLFVNVGTYFYSKIFVEELLLNQIIAATIGCFLIFLGVAIFIAVDIGLDPMTGVTMVLRDKLKWDYRRAKILFDLSLTLGGFLLGGKLGVITVITALSGGPIIQFIASRLSKIIKN